MLLLPLLLAAVPGLAYMIVPGLTDPSQPACTLVTFYYNDAVELASATSSFLSSSAFCTTTSSATPSASPALCVFPATKRELSNPGFECIGANALDPWPVYPVPHYGSVRIVAGTNTNAAHSGSYMLQHDPLPASGEIFLYQLVSNTPGSNVTFSWWVKLDPVYNSLTGCDFSAGALLSNGLQPHRYFLGQGGSQSPTTIWQQYTFSFTGTGNDKIYVQWRHCTAGTIMYVDDFTYSG